MFNDTCNKYCSVTNHLLPFARIACYQLNDHNLGPDAKLPFLAHCRMQMSNFEHFSEHIGDLLRSIESQGELSNDAPPADRQDQEVQLSEVEQPLAVSQIIGELLI